MKSDPYGGSVNEIWVLVPPIFFHEIFRTSPVSGSIASGSSNEWNVKEPWYSEEDVFTRKYVFPVFVTIVVQRTFVVEGDKTHPWGTRDIMR